MRTPDYLRKKVQPQKTKNLRKELSRTIRHHFPRVGGVRMSDLCADLVLEVVYKHLVPRDHLRHGQILWLGIDIDDPPSRNKTSENVRLLPVILDLSADEDLDALLDRTPSEERLLKRCLRLFTQAFDQGALLSNVDIAVMLAVSDSTIAKVVAHHERTNAVIVPRRATIHDVGSGVTHKRIICWKRYVERKTSDVIARETYHSITAVDRYLGAFDRVRMCNRQGLAPGEIALALACTERLVHEYLAIDALLDTREAK